jgi:hypothetical protein
MGHEIAAVRWMVHGHPINLSLPHNSKYFAMLIFSRIKLGLETGPADSAAVHD